jgi:NADP-dependent 3-hydroxy acid dehydrogenase YdfG
MNDIFNIHNKIAFITGGANGLGAQLVEAYSQAGCKVAFCDLKKDEIDKEIKYIKEKYKNDIIGLVCDVSNENSVKKCINEIIKKYKTIDILVNNAGVAIGGTIENYTSTQ